MSLTTQLVPLVTEALQRGPTAEADPTDEAILGGTVKCIGRFGLDRFSIDDVAEAAGVGRATVFRRFGSKQEIVRRALAREGFVLLEQLKSAVADIDNRVERVVEFGVAVGRLTRDHPVAARLADDGSITSLLGDRQVVSLLRSTAERELAILFRGEDVDTEALTEVFLRLFVSVCVLPDLGMRIDDETIRRLIRTVLRPVS